MQIVQRVSASTRLSGLNIELCAGATAADLLKLILEKHPQLASCISTCVMAVNLEYLSDNAATKLKANDEVAIIPPISGG